MSDAGAEAVKPDPRCSWRLVIGGWVRVSGMKVRSLAVFSNHSAFHQRSAQSVALSLLSSDELMSCWAGGLYVSIWDAVHSHPVDRLEIRHTRDSVAPLRWRSRRRHPVTVRKAALMAEPIRGAWALRHQTGAYYCSVEWARDKASIMNNGKAKLSCNHNSYSIYRKYFSCRYRPRKYSNQISAVEEMQNIFNFQQHLPL